MSKSGVACYRNGGCGPYEMYSCSECPASKSDYVQFKPKPITNADRIRAMTDEELDKFLDEVQWDVANYCGDVTQKQKYPFPDQKGAWLDWLKQEATE